ncbi:MAG: HDOD domain-containing protein [Pseudomonadales bacterium]|nr:HDOD domain-containing protein [Pseudomonadales bacterium]
MSVSEMISASGRTGSLKPLTMDDIPNCSVADRVILEMIIDNDVDLDQLSEVIQENPSLSALIIGLANSAYYSSPSSIFSIKDAIIKVLGMRMVRSVVLSVILGKSLDVSQCKEFSVQDFWTDNLTAARFCQLLVSETSLKTLVSSEEIYLYALLAGFGELVMIQHYPFEMNELILATEGKLNIYIAAQEAQFGITQAEAGVLMSKRWGLPELVTKVMQNLFKKDYRGDNWEVCVVVGAVINLVNEVRNGEKKIGFDPAIEEILGKNSSECNLDQIVELRSVYQVLAKHLMSGSN